MECICSSCGERFEYTGSRNWVKYCPGCRKKATAQNIRRRDERRRAAKRRNVILDPGPAHKLDLDTVLQELEQFNTLRRAEGQSSISYGQYVAMRDKYIRISHSQTAGPGVRPPEERGKPAVKLPEKPVRALAG